MTSENYFLVLCTCGSIQEAEAVTTALLEERLAACINRLTGVKSSYRWEGRVSHDDEALLLIKTTGEAYPRLEAMIKSIHSYDTPEIIALPIAAGSAAYLDWIGTSTA
jgi:periplasmic divalent cation tolerance protein